MSESLPSLEGNKKLQIIAYQYGGKFELIYNEETKLFSDGYHTYTVQNLIDNLNANKADLMRPMDEKSIKLLRLIHHYQQ